MISVRLTLRRLPVPHVVIPSHLTESELDAVDNVMPVLGYLLGARS